MDQYNSNTKGAQTELSEAKDEGIVSPVLSRPYPDKLTLQTDTYKKHSSPLAHTDGNTDGNVSILDIPQKLNKTHRTDIDLTIFKDSHAVCIHSSDDIPITERCSHTKRLCAASIYLHHMNQSTKLSDDDKRSLILEFQEEVFPFMLDDVIHFIQEHEQDIDIVHREWTEQFGCPKCSISECIQTTRHYTRDHDQMDHKVDSDHDSDNELYTFYESLYDQLHHYIFHLFEAGMRVDASVLALDDKGDDEKMAAPEGVTVDKLFTAERDQIKSKRKGLKVRPNRTDDENNKFTINVNIPMMGDITVTDALFQKIRETNGLPEELMHRLNLYFVDNLYDSECIEMDIEDFEDSNIYPLIQSQMVIETMKQIIASTNLLRKAFSTGFEFKYEEWYRDREQGNYIYLQPKYGSLKEEIMQSGHLSPAKWTKFVVLKAQKYIETQRVKKMHEKIEDSPVLLEHLFVVILYCDFSVLCTAFSETYRRENVFETIESVKSRHSEYANFGRLLEETVRCFGVDGFPVDDVKKYNNGQNTQSGPFYCGINCILNIGSFAITLKAPCSTSTVRAVAVNFAKEQGMILQLDNDCGDSWLQTFFDCSWISSYFEESERLWIAGHRPQRIVSVTIVQTAINHRIAMRSLYLFDAMISGVRQYDNNIEPNELDYDIISNLLNWTLSGDHCHTLGIDEYIKSEWNLFVQNKKKIHLNLWQLDRYYRALSTLVMFDVTYNKFKGKWTQQSNVMRSRWLSIFRSVHTISIWTNGMDYNFSLAHFEAQIKLMSPSIRISITDNGDWISGELSKERCQHMKQSEDIPNMMVLIAGRNAKYDGRDLVIAEASLQ